MIVILKGKDGRVEQLDAPDDAKYLFVCRAGERRAPPAHRDIVWDEDGIAAFIRKHRGRSATVSGYEIKSVAVMAGGVEMGA